MNLFNTQKYIEEIQYLRVFHSTMRKNVCKFFLIEPITYKYLVNNPAICV